MTISFPINLVSAYTLKIWMVKTNSTVTDQVDFRGSLIAPVKLKAFHMTLAVKSCRLWSVLISATCLTFVQ